LICFTVITSDNRIPTHLTTNVMRESDYRHCNIFSVVQKIADIINDTKISLF